MSSHKNPGADRMESKPDRVWNILMVDDDWEDYLITASMLKQTNSYRVALDWVKTAEAGFESICEKHYDLALIDYDLDGETGIELIRRLTEQGCKVPLVLYTGRGSSEVDLEAMQAGATMYLTKSEANPLLIERIIRYAVERKQAEASLAESEKRYQALAEATFEGIVLSNNGRILDLNDQMARIFGYEPGELIGQELSVLTAPEDKQRIMENAIRQTEGLFSYICLRKDGSRFLVEARAKVITYNDLRVRVTAMRDITEQQKIKDALSERGELNNSFFYNAHTAMLLIDPDNGQIVEANPAASAFYGWSREELLGKKVMEITTVPPDEVERNMQQVQASPPYRKYTFHDRMANGEIREVDVHTGPITIGDKKYIFSIVHDFSRH